MKARDPEKLIAFMPKMERSFRSFLRRMLTQVPHDPIRAGPSAPSLRGLFKM
jgi:hypothetical protein